MRTARTLEAEWKYVLRGSVSTGAKEDELSTERGGAAGFHNVAVSSRLAGVGNKRTIYLFIFQMLGARDELRILNQWIWWHACNVKICSPCVNQIP
jgi:hypothetical protein